MEEIVWKKIELERLQENETYVKNILNRWEIEIGEIDEEIKIRNGESA